uniref:glucose-1-phosphate adenylyltransferase n=1 Tax=Pyramimonas obovata TaxID=1411642 RepID=A0A7S0QTD3_9CHLO|mmetsp:Transcript_10215/g.21304  ORF Transcript_10215/g.21304 Transcript_10215/m.21304 type:complete len:436 (+) Transcript_10215:31-1338(+)
MPLTARRAKPAVPIGGGYRLIDVPMSNCINSGIKKIYVMTQFNSRTLNRHLKNAYDLTSQPGSNGFCEVLSAFQAPETKTMKGKGWFIGTADAVRKFSWKIQVDPMCALVDDVLILAGDHLYRMDYMEFVEHHRARRADITVAAIPVEESKASALGLMRCDEDGRVTAFVEKPKGDKLKAWKVKESTYAALGADDPTVVEEKPFLASMGIYVFKKDLLLKLLREDMPLATDFGSEVLPEALESHNIHAYLFNDYWEDIGTIKSFFKANLALAKRDPRFDFYHGMNKRTGKAAPIYTRSRTLTPALVAGGEFHESILAKGTLVEEGCVVQGSVVGVRSHLEPGVFLKDVLMIGADFYEERDLREEVRAEGKVPLGIGQNTVIENAIIDKNVRIGRNCVLTNERKVQKLKKPEAGYYIDDGIIVFMPGAIVPDGTVI